jgi:MoaA/NifB/PqqE/SkfB family radical SAM enzyme
MTKKLEDYEWICPEPFTNIYAGTTGYYLPCCIIDTRDLSFIKKTHNINEDSFFEFYNSYDMKRLRSSMKNNNDQEFINKICSVCKNQEKSGNKSHRQWYISRFIEGDFKDKKNELEVIIEENKQPTFFHSIEYDALSGNLCNLSCNMCTEYSSSRYFSESIKLKEVINKNPLIQIKPNEKVLKELPEILSKINELKLVGGEPLLAEYTYKLMEMTQNKQNVIVRLITNATNNPERFIKLANLFKKITINISIEGYQEVNDYIRYPSKWNVIQENVKKLKTIKNNKIIFVSTINALNIGKLYEIIENVKEDYTMSSIVTNNFYSINSIPDDIKNMYLNLYYSKINKYNSLGKEQAKKLIKYLEYSIYNEQDMIKMIQHIKRRDKLRNTNMLNLFPEWKSYYEKH